MSFVLNMIWHYSVSYKTLKGKVGNSEKENFHLTLLSYRFVATFGNNKESNFAIKLHHLNLARVGGLHDRRHYFYTNPDYLAENNLSSHNVF